MTDHFCDFFLILITKTRTASLNTKMCLEKCPEWVRTMCTCCYRDLLIEKEQQLVGISRISSFAWTVSYGADTRTSPSRWTVNKDPGKCLYSIIWLLLIEEKKIWYRCVHFVQLIFLCLEMTRFLTVFNIFYHFDVFLIKEN